MLGTRSREWVLSAIWERLNLTLKPHHDRIAHLHRRLDALEEYYGVREVHIPDHIEIRSKP